ncbi:effector-associated constant component EACC1 [Streptomyces shenzhenensis]|uniref:effector-associated constant component EACC1 n=1 Tax=Streptomyces shenzhenensis TaxID=943815 RepID=UPI0015F00BCC|nr:hypothetical protein [Streptomyces shenzhenensis]
MDVLLGVRPDGAASAEESERLTRRLRAELRGLDLHRLQVLTGGASREDNGKGDGSVTAGAVVLALSVPGGVLPSLIGLVRDWLGRQSAPHRVSVTVDGDTIEVDATAEEQRQLIDLYVRRHSVEGE